MSDSARVMSDLPTVEPSQPLVFETLSDFGFGDRPCPSAIGQKLDLLLLAIEALQLGGTEYMLAMTQELGLPKIIRNRVVLWRLRCTNPWRHSHSRRYLSLDEARALAAVLTHLARRLTALIRQLLLSEQKLRQKGLPLDNHFRLANYLDQFRSHFRSRMNPRRAKVAAYLESPDQLNQLALSLLNQLLFCTGTAGTQRLWLSLFDGEVG
ncbi:MAG: DUF3038 domain-containing protein [Chloroflexaceae bacterium]|nr:DUF3038 domain-containing protein [Chloroflexaceae bacterium]